MQPLELDTVSTNKHYQTDSQSIQSCMTGDCAELCMIRCEGIKALSYQPFMRSSCLALGAHEKKLRPRSHLINDIKACKHFWFKRDFVVQHTSTLTGRLFCPRNFANVNQLQINVLKLLSQYNLICSINVLYGTKIQQNR